MKLNKIYEKYRRQRDGRYQLQVIDLWTDVRSEEEAEGLSSLDFFADLYINRQYIGDISFVLDEAGILSELVSMIDWALEFKKAVGDEKERKGDELFTAKKDSE